METYWDNEKAGGLPSFLGHIYPTEFICRNGDDCVVRVDIINGGLLLFDKPGEGGVAFAAKILPLDESLRKSVFDMVELHAEDWGPSPTSMKHGGR